MAQEIKALGESLLSQAKKRRKKLEKRQKIFSGLMLGVSVGNIFLRRQAEKRMNEFINSNAGVLQQRKAQFKQGINFWSDHEKMMQTYGMGTGDTNWEDAFTLKQKELYRKRDLDGLNLATKTLAVRQEFDKEVEEKIKDDIEAYGKKLDIFSNFKNIDNTEENRKLYLKPLTDNFVKAQKIIKKEGNVGNFLINKLRGKSGLEDITFEGTDTQLRLPKSFSDEDRDNFRKNIILNEAYLEKIDEANELVKYQPLSSELLKRTAGGLKGSDPVAGHETVIKNLLKDDKSANQYALAKIKFETTLSNSPINFRQIYVKLGKQKNVGREDRVRNQQMFVEDILTYSKQAKIAFDSNPDNEGEVKRDEFFIEQGIRQYLALNPTLSKGDNETPVPTNQSLNIYANMPFTMQSEGRQVEITPNKLLGRIREMVKQGNLEDAKENYLQIEKLLLDEEISQDMIEARNITLNTIRNSLELPNLGENIIDSDKPTLNTKKGQLELRKNKLEDLLSKELLKEESLQNDKLLNKYIEDLKLIDIEMERLDTIDNEELLKNQSSGENVTQRAVELVSFGDENAVEFLMEISKVESKYGTDPRTFQSDRISKGIFQIDPVALEEVQRRLDPNADVGANIRRYNEQLIESYNIDLSKITSDDLDKPLISAAVARAYLLSVPEALPKAGYDNREARARYWKTYYNTSEGAGTVDYYLNSTRI